MKDSFYERKTGFSQTYFLSRVVKDAKRPPKVSFFIRKNGLNPLWWTEPSAVILQISGLTPLPATLRALARLDGAFYDRKIVESLDARRLGYTIVARMYQPLKNRMVQGRYHEFSRGWQAADFT